MKPTKLNTQRQRTITPADLEAANRLKSIWDSLGRAKRGTQADAAAAWGDHANQSLISQYLNGSIALNYSAILFFSNYLKCLPTDIRNDLPEQQLDKYAPPRGDQVALRFGVRDDPAPLNVDILQASISALDAAIKASKVRLSAKRKAALLAEIYAHISAGIGMERAAKLVTASLIALSEESTNHGNRK